MYCSLYCNVRSLSDRIAVKTFSLLHRPDLVIPASTSWYLADLGEFRGKQTLYTRQSPQRLKALREHALIESAVSSNRMEGVEIEPSRVRDILVAPKPLFRDRDEEEVRGYRDALALIHEQAADLVVSDDTVRRPHRMARGEIWDAGAYKEKDGDIIERYPDGRERVRFRTVPASETGAWLPRKAPQSNASGEARGRSGGREGN